MGVGKHANIVHLIDFGLSKQFRNPNTHLHIPFNKGLSLVGTAAFTSINSHLGLEQGRRDDLESLAYILFYFVWGFLPWDGMGQRDILKSKQGITTLGLFRELPSEFRLFFEHCRSLSFDEKPNYDHFCHLFDNLLAEGLHGDAAFDWDVAHAKIPGQDSEGTSNFPLHERNPPCKRRLE